MIGSQEVIVPTKEKVGAPETRIKAFSIFSEAFKPTLHTIYYPGSNIDISPSKTTSFQGNRIIYVDRDRSAIQSLQRKGYDAHVGNARVFDPGEVNLLLLFNFYANKPLKHVVKNGYVICNQHWKEKAFTKIFKKKDFEFVGVLVDANGVIRLDTESLENYSAAPNYNRGKAENLFVFRKETQ
jgi:hypothetical protein